jgi:hypothetical protein
MYGTTVVPLQHRGAWQGTVNPDEYPEARYI